MINETNESCVSNCKALYVSKMRAGVDLLCVSKFFEKRLAFSKWDENTRRKNKRGSIDVQEQP